MSISSALITANTGLAASSRRAATVSNNVANALTPGYARRELSVSESVVNGRGAGVTINGAVRAADKALTAERRLAEGVSGRDQTIATAHASFNNALGEPGDSFSLFAQYQNLETGLRALSQTPESQPLQSQVLDSAKALASSFHDLSRQTRTVREGADARIAQEVDEINSALKQIEKLNRDISAASAGGRDSAALEDQRQRLIDQVSQSIPVREVPRGNNTIDLMTQEGVFLVAGSAREIEFSQTGTILSDMSLAGGSLSGLSVNGIDITPGSGDLGVRQGTIAGHFAVRDDIAPDFQTQLDGLARDVIERFENIDPTLTPGDPGLFTDAGAAFDPANELGLAERIAVNAAVDPDQGGAVWRLRDGLGATAEGPSAANDIIVTMLGALTELRTPPAGTGLVGAQSAINAAAGVTSTVGRSRISAEEQLASSSARTELLSDAELTATGVDTDQELQKLILIEQAFTANARIIQAADEMLRTLMEI